MSTVHDPPASTWPIVCVGAATVGVGVATLALAAAHATSLVLHQRLASVGAQQLGSLFSAHGDPVAAWGPNSGVSNAVMFWTVFCALMLAAMVGAVRAWVWWRPRRERAALRNHPGLGAKWKAYRAAGALATRRTARRLTGRRVGIDEAAYQMGHIGSRPVYANLEDSGVIYGPPRCGKGVSFVIPMVLDAPGAVVATGTRPETLAVTLQHRRTGDRPVAIFDPQGLSGLSPGLRWSLIRGCESAARATIRAQGLAAATDASQGTANEGHWHAVTSKVAARLLHAAAIAGKKPADVYRWSVNSGAAREALTILTANPAAERGWADYLRGLLDGEDPKYRENAWAGVSQAFESLSLRHVQDLVDPGEHDWLDPVAFTRAAGTLYMLGTATGSGLTKQLNSAIINDFAESNRVRASRLPGGRLDTPLLLMLDEITQLGNLPGISGLLADGGGTGINVFLVTQSPSRVETAWSTPAKQAIEDDAAWLVSFGGIRSTRDVEAIAALAGQRRVRTQSSTSTGGAFMASSWNHGWSVVPALDPQTVRTIPDGMALASIRRAGLFALDLQDWRSRRDVATLQADRTYMYELIRDSGGDATQPQDYPASDYDAVVDLSDSNIAHAQTS